MRLPCLAVCICLLIVYVDGSLDDRIAKKTAKVEKWEDRCADLQNEKDKLQDLLNLKELREQRQIEEGYDELIGYNCPSDNLHVYYDLDVPQCLVECSERDDCYGIAFFTGDGRCFLKAVQPCALKLESIWGLEWTMYIKKQDCASAAYYKLGNWDCGGNDIDFRDGLTVEECGAWCCSLPVCVAYNYAFDTPNNRCYAKFKCENRGSSSVFDLYLPHSIYDIPGYVWQANRDCAGNDIISLPDTSLAECTAQCDSLPNCVAFDYAFPQNPSGCNLKHTCVSKHQSTLFDLYTKN